MALLLGAAVLAAFLLSAFFLAAEAGHDCTGEDCPICAVLQMCEETVHKLGTGLVLLAVWLLSPLLFATTYDSISDYSVPALSLISQKVRMEI